MDGWMEGWMEGPTFFVSAQILKDYILPQSWSRVHVFIALVTRKRWSELAKVTWTLRVRRSKLSFVLVPMLLRGRGRFVSKTKKTAANSHDFFLFLVTRIDVRSSIVRFRCRIDVHVEAFIVVHPDRSRLRVRAHRFCLVLLTLYFYLPTITSW